jgi:hypothetical protein
MDTRPGDKMKMLQGFWVCSWLLVTTMLFAGCKRPAEVIEPPLLIPTLRETAAESDARLTPELTYTEQPTTIPTASQVTTDVKPLEGTGLRLAVAFMTPGNLLNVRSGPGATFDVVDTLDADAQDLLTTGQRELNDEILWVEIQRAGGESGWVSSDFVTEQVDSEIFCNDSQVGTVLDKLGLALRNKDGRSLALLVSPLHGLTLHHDFLNPGVTIRDAQVTSVLFNSTTDYDWGVLGDTGEALIGPFKDVILPGIEEVVLQNHTRHCNTLEEGVATGIKEEAFSPTSVAIWPGEYRKINYVALYQAAPPDDETGWRTLGVGIEYVDGKAYLAVIIPYTR